MLRITGDTHGDLSRINYAENYENTPLGEGDTLIICGDFGFVFDGGKLERAKLDLLGTKPYTVCFIDGNHENFDLLSAYPKTNFHGGRAHRLRENVYHLMRGEIYEFEGKRIFTMGGAYSTDRYMRVLDESYWEQELPSDCEYSSAVRNLERVNREVDIILSHTAPSEMIQRLGGQIHPSERKLTGFLDYIKSTVSHSNWFCGHLHTDKTITESFRSLYFDCVDV